MVGWEKLPHKILKNQVCNYFIYKVKNWSGRVEQKYFDGEKYRFIDVLLKKKDRFNRVSCTIPVEIGSTDKKEELLEKYNYWINIKKDGNVEFENIPLNVKKVIDKIVEKYSENRKKIKNLQKRIESVREDFEEIEEIFERINVSSLLNHDAKELLFPKTRG